MIFAKLSIRAFIGKNIIKDKNPLQDQLNDRKNTSAATLK